MTDERITHLGVTLPLSKWVAHYRMMIRGSRWPNRKQLYRDLLRCVIREARQQRAGRVERIAA